LDKFGNVLGDEGLEDLVSIHYEVSIPYTWLATCMAGTPVGYTHS